MELNPHDLIRVDHPDHLLTDLPLPAWAALALLNAPYVVVRRAVSPEGFVPVGIRGRKKNERLAAWLNISAVREVISPQMLVAAGQWNIIQGELNDPIISLKNITPVLNARKFCWGPTGSTAFELTTGVKTLTAGSDLDLVIRCNNPLSVDEGELLLEKLNAATLVRLDVQLDTPMGGVSLKEYISYATVLVKTSSGPLLAKRDALWAGTKDLANSFMFKS